MNRASFGLLTCLGWAASCDMSAPVVKLPVEGGGPGNAGAAGQIVTGGTTSATGGSVNPADPYGESRYDWCLPPAYDPMLVPSDPPCDLLFPITTRNVQRWTATILLDRARSMQQALPGSATSKWVGVRNALSLLAAEPSGFLDQWSLMAFARSDSFEVSENCVAESYSIGQPEPTRQPPPLLNVTDILAQFDRLGPTASVRPTAAALQGAILDAQHNAETFRGTSTPIVIVITDGPPYGCSSATEMTDLVKVAQDANSPTVINYTPIHVVQLGEGYDLSPVAQAGAQNTHYLISGGDVARQLVKVLRRILYPGPPDCAAWLKFSIANGAKSLDFDVRMRSVYASGQDLSPPRLASPEACGESPAGGFWAVEAGSDKSYTLGLCPCTCAAMGTDLTTVMTTYCSK
jgi:hypothetical protein